jgi:glyoxylase-like metal-dependent hydrolase (beta-lactamase superfamily II)
MLNIKQLVFNPFDENTYIITDVDTNKAAVIDPGMYNPREQKEFDDFVAQSGVKIDIIINTHLHLDHSFSINHVRQKYGVKLAANAGDAALGRAIKEQGMRFGFVSRNDLPVEIDQPLHNNDTITLGNTTLQVLHVPGHSQGGIAIYSAADGVVFSGDSLFCGSIGRTDLTGGNELQLIESIQTKLLTLPDSTIVLPGHGPHTSIAAEKAHNPYIR